MKQNKNICIIPLAVPIEITKEGLEDYIVISLLINDDEIKKVIKCIS